MNYFKFFFSWVYDKFSGDCTSTLLIISGSIGAVAGLGMATWQVPIQSAQFLLGWIEFPPTSNEYYLNASVYSLLNYLAASLLLISKSEVFSSIFISVFLGIISLQVIAMLLYSATKDMFASLFLACIIWKGNLFPWGVAYPIYFMEGPHSYGRAALMFPIYAILLFSMLKNKNLGMLALGISMGIHPTTGTWVLICFVIAKIIQGKALRQGLCTRENFMYAAYWFLGAAISFIPYLHQKYFFNLNAYNFGVVEYAAIEEMFNNYIRYWDYHRRNIREVHLLVCGALAAFVSIGLSYVFLKRDALIHRTNFVYYFFIVAGVFSVPLIYFPSSFNPIYINHYLLAIMPGRFINFSLLVLVPLFSSLVFLGWTGRREFALYLMIGIIIACLVSFDNVDFNLKKFYLSLFCISIFFILSKVRHLLKPLNYIISKSGILFIIFAGVFLSYGYSGVVSINFRERAVPLDFLGSVLTTKDDIFFQAKHRVATITPHLDGYPYLGNAKILINLNEYTTEIFGISLKDPPQDGSILNRSGFEVVDYGKLWSARSCEAWVELSKKYHFGLIRVPSHIALQLPRHGGDVARTEYLPQCKH